MSKFLTLEELFEIHGESMMKLHGFTESEVRALLDQQLKNAEKQKKDIQDKRL